MTARVIDGKALAQTLRASIAKAVGELKSRYNFTPGLAVVLVGEDPASQVYVRNKHRQTLEAGMNSWEHRLSATTSETELLALVDELGRNPDVHGILVQLPLPKQIDTTRILNAVNPVKDVDGFHILNAGKLFTGQESLVPCTPVGCVLLAKHVLGKLEGVEAVIVGRSNIVGKPVAQLLLQENCTVTIAHSRTRNLEEVCRRADLLVAAVGRAEMIRGSWIKPGACVVDVGINRIERDGKAALVGDCDYESCSRVAGAITPVPGGVGPMTIACLLRNTLKAGCMQKSIPMPAL